jgi:DNA polymerase III subunit epsilon
MSDQEWRGSPWVGFDLETTGREQHLARIVTAALVVEADRSQDQEWLVNPGIPIPAESTAVHGITDADVAKAGIPAGQACDDIARALERHWSQGAIIVAYNAQYDLTVLTHELARHDRPAMHPGPVLDPLVLWRVLEKYRKGKKRLSDAVERFEVPMNVKEHDAGADALTAVHVMRAVADLDGLAEVMTVAEIMDQQANWHRQWADSFADWLTAQGGDASGVDRSWPIGSSA